MPFPSTFSAFNRPNPTDRLNTPSHSELHNTVSSALGQLEAVIGIQGDNSVLGTIMTDLRSPGSQGGGHVQGAAFGGTGQTVYMKGDLLVGQSASVISRLAVGLDGQVPIADSSVASGIKWAVSPGNKIYASASIISVPSGIERSVLSTTIVGSLLGTSNAVKTQSFIEIERMTGVEASILGRVQYGGATVGTIVLRPSGVLNSSIIGVVNHTMIGNGLVNSQRHILTFQAITTKPLSGQFAMSVLSVGSSVYSMSTSAVDSSANQTYGFTLQYGHADAFTQMIQVDGSTVERIT